MQSWDRPPPGIAVAEFFERWLPEAFAASGRQAPADAPTVRASISGADGGAWDLVADGGALDVRPPGREAPDVWIRQSVADLRVALGGPDPDLPVAAAGRMVGAGSAVRRSARRRSAATDLRAAAVRARGTAAAALGPRRRVRQGGRQRGASALDAAPRRRHVRGAAVGCDAPDAAASRRAPQDRGRPRAGDAAPTAAREPARPALTSRRSPTRRGRPRRPPAARTSPCAPPSRRATRGRRGASPNAAAPARARARARAGGRPRPSAIALRYSATASSSSCAARARRPAGHARPRPPRRRRAAPGPSERRRSVLAPARPPARGRAGWTPSRSLPLPASSASATL